MSGYYNYFRNDFVEEEQYQETLKQRDKEDLKKEYKEYINKLKENKLNGITNLKEILKIELAKENKNYEFIETILQQIDVNEIKDLWPNIINIIVEKSKTIKNSRYLINYYEYYKNSGTLNIPLELVVDTLIFNHDCDEALNFLIDDEKEHQYSKDENTISGKNCILLKRKLIQFIAESKKEKYIYRCLMFVHDIQYDQAEQLLNSFLDTRDEKYLKKFLDYAPLQYLHPKFVEKAKKIAPPEELSILKVERPKRKIII